MVVGAGSASLNKRFGGFRNSTKKLLVKVSRKKGMIINLWSPVNKLGGATYISGYIPNNTIHHL